ncbi:MAG: endolytic transglycosylase MltG [Symploca sp. SIO2E6]|nr:endolytic transglycosylase MltG [Symploca sp. SIO2E6]
MKAFKDISKWSYYFVLLPVVLGGCLWQSWAWWSWAKASPILEESSDWATEQAIQIQIRRGTTSGQIGNDLEAAGLVRSAQAWRLWSYWMRLQEPGGSFKAGTYKLSPTQPLAEIAQKIWHGEVMQLSFTIPEGWSLQQMGTYFESLGYFSRREFITAAGKIPQEQYPWLPKELPHLEGYLYPDTYKLSSDRVTPEQIIQRMLDRFEEVALPLYQERPDQTKLNLDEWVTLASIVEKEAAIASERPLIAGVFTQRLQREMKLEADPTVEYGLGIRQTADQPLTLAQVKTPSPYNTYLNPGLPPTPIASPSLDSLRAALYPEITDYLYFVARYDGTHFFSKTLEAHEAATRAIREQREAQQGS